VVERIPYLAEDIVEFLQGVEQLILVGAKPPVTFFAYPGKTSWPTPLSSEPKRTLSPNLPPLSRPKSTITGSPG
jgi:hypothetical protein